MIIEISRSVLHAIALTNILFAVIFWALALLCLRVFFEVLARTFFSKNIPVPFAYIPSQIPHPNPPGSAVPFEIPLVEATDVQIHRFMHFRQHGKAWSKEDGLGIVAMTAAAYKGELYEERLSKWIDDHFRKRLPKLRYPYVAPHWNSWSSFWAETGPQVRRMCIASMVLIVEHLMTGLVLPALYLYSGEVVYFEMSMYGEIGYQIVSIALIIASYVLKRDVTIEQMHSAVWPLLLIHHVSTVFLCALGLGLGDLCPRKEVCGFLFSLLGLTSTLHYVGQILDFSPCSQANAPYVRLTNHLIALVSMVWFRCIYWFKIAYFAIDRAAEIGGYATAIPVGLVLLLFTAFNADFIKFHVKATIGCWKKTIIPEEKLTTKEK